MKHLSVLIIEDSIYAADLNVRQIIKSGFSVDYKRVENLKSMEKALNEQTWDIILSDHSMPFFNAIKAIDARNRFDRNIPFIVVTEGMSDNELSQVMEAGCNGYITKENLSELREVMKFFL